MSNKLTKFKKLIQEFHEDEIPQYIERQIDIPLELKNIHKAITILGPRRSGKTFIFYQLISQLEKKYSKDRIIYINFEDDRILPLTLNDLQQLIDAYFELYPENKNKTIYLFLDEIQNIDNWETFVRRVLDKEKAQVYITGSSSKLLSHELATSLGGRAISFNVHPLNFKEFLEFKGLQLKKNFQFSKQRFEIKKLLEEYIISSRFPEAVIVENEALQKHILQGYYDSIVYKDLADRYSIRNVTLLKDLLKHLLANITKPLSVGSYYKTTKQRMSLSKDTIYEYLSHIEETGYFHLLPIFSYSLKEQRVNPKKIISIDNGLRNKIAFTFSTDSGKLAENLVGQTLIEQNSEVYYWSDDLEVDFVSKEGKNLNAINVSYSDEILERELDSLLAFQKTFKSKVQSLTLITKDIEDEHQDIKIIPLWEWLLKS